MKLWQKDYEVEKIIEIFTVGKDRELDLELSEFDVLGSLAHIQMLQSIDLLTVEEWKLLKLALIEIYADIKKGNFAIENGVEDVHSQVELLLTRKLGEIGKKIHSGRSRNDQVLVDMKLYMRSEIQKIAELTSQLFDLLISQSETYKHVLLAGYTHLQIAMPSSFGLWFAAYAESLTDDLTVLQSAYQVVNQNPLGSAAGYGSSFPLNRTLTTKLLAFENLNFNVVYAQMSRGKSEKILAFALANLASTLAKMSMDVCLYMNQNFDFLTLPKELTTGSSIMPHKKNPDVFELIRGKCNRLQALPNQISMMLVNLPSGYHRDLQLVKEEIVPAIQEMQNCLSVAIFTIKNLIVKENILADPKYQYLFSVEAVNEKVLAGTSFREAYKEVGKEIEAGNFHFSGQIHHTHEGSIGNLCNDQILAKKQNIWASFGFEKLEKMLDLLK